MNALTIRNFEPVAVEIAPEATKAKASALDRCRGITKVASPADEQGAVDALSAVRRVAKELEASRTTVKKPVLDIGKKIDQLAKDFGADLNSEYDRVNKLVTLYVREQQQIAEAAERKRQEEIRKAEQERLDALQKQEEAELALIQANGKEDHEKKEAELASLQAKAEAKAPVFLPPAAPPPKAEGSIVREVFTFSVNDIHALYAANRALVRMEPNAAAINEAIRKGMRDCPGLIITKETKVGVRS